MKTGDLKRFAGINRDYSAKDVEKLKGISKSIESKTY